MYSSCRGVQGGDQEHCQHVLRVKIILEDFNLPVSTLTAKLPNLTRIKFTGYMVFASSVHIATNNPVFVCRILTWGFAIILPIQIDKGLIPRPSYC